MKAPSPSATCALVLALSSCKTPTHSTSRSAVDAAVVAAAVSDAGAVLGLRGVTHEELLRRADAAARGDVTEEIEVTGERVPADEGFADEQPVDATRSRYLVQFPGEPTTPRAERVLLFDDSGERAVALLYGNGLPVAPGLRVAARGSMAPLALVAQDQRSHRAMSPDALRAWFFGEAPRGSTEGAITFRRSDGAIVATRGSLTLTMALDASASARPLGCRIIVAMMLGGDPIAARTGCEGAGPIARATLRARGIPSLTLLRETTTNVQLPRASMAVPPATATAVLTVPERAAQGAFFSPAELQSLRPIVRAGESPRRADAGLSSAVLEVRNTLSREAVVSVDGAVIGWLAAGQTARFVGIPAGRHAVAARSIDGVERATLRTETEVPGVVELYVGPLRVSAAR